MAQTDTLEVTQCRNYANEHFFELFGLPKNAHLLALAIDVLQVKPMLNILADNADSESVVHGFVEEISIKLNNIGVVLGFEKLDGLFLSRLFEMKSQNLLCIRLAYQVF
jgi:hypothetical protein